MSQLRTSTSAALAATCLLALSVLGATEKPDPAPAPTARPARKLGGGSFGLPPGPTPTAGVTDFGLAAAARKAYVETPIPGQKPSHGVVITNESLRKTEPTPAGASITIKGKPGTKPVAKKPPTPKPDQQPVPEYRDASGRTEADWRARASQARERIERAGKDVVAAQAEVRRLENDFYAWSDGNYRDKVIRPAWDQAKERLKALETEVESANAAMADLEDEARKSGTPPGWLR